MFRQKTTDQRKRHLQVTFQVTINTQERYSEQTYLEPQQEQFRSGYLGGPYGQPLYSPPEYQQQWDWYSLLGFVFPFVVLMLPAGIASMAYVTAFVLSGSYNIYVNFFLLFSFFIVLYVQSLYLLLGRRIRAIYDIKKYTIISWIYPILIEGGIYVLFCYIFRLHLELNPSFYDSMNFFIALFLLIAIIFIIPGILGLLHAYIRYKYSDGLFCWLYYDYLAKYGKRIGLLKDRYSRY
jgi:hypothetical protein